MDDNDLPIGVFDSGLGGLTVVRSIMEQLPDESILYLGDTARVPYGTKSPATVRRYALQSAQTLLKRGIKVLIVACNTASAHGLEAVQGETAVPVLGVVEPGARAAAEATRSGRIGVIGTRGTIASGEYRRALQSIAPKADVYAVHCPLFVPLAEEGWSNTDVAEGVARVYLAPLLDKGIDTLLLGCTHYPLLQDTLSQVAGDSVTIVDSAHATAATLAEVLDAMHLRRENQSAPEYRYLVTDAPELFREGGEAFLGHPLDSVEWIDLQ
jgi:glutamate racemase